MSLEMKILYEKLRIARMMAVEHDRLSARLAAINARQERREALAKRGSLTLDGILAVIGEREVAALARARIAQAFDHIAIQHDRLNNA